MVRKGRSAFLMVAVAAGLLGVPAAGRSVSSGEPYVQQLTAGYGHTCAVFSDGSVKCWGRNSDGQLGLEDTFSRGDGPQEMGAALTPIELGAGWRVIQVAAGGAHTCALRDTGEVKCWGQGTYGQLGLGGTESKGDDDGEMGEQLSTVDLGVGWRVIQIAAGGAHTCALRDTGEVKCWGSNAYGELGQGSTENQGDNYAEVAKLLPVELGEPALAVSAGMNYTCAVLESGEVKCWGRNGSGELGLGDTLNRGDGPNEMGTALPAVDLGEVALTVAAGPGTTRHTCALLASGAVKCWGANDFGQLGQGDTAIRGDAPDEMGAFLPDVDLVGTARAVFTGQEFGCALLDSAEVRCWGRSQYGQLGLGDTSTRGDAASEMGAALPVADLGGTVFLLAVGNYHSCALLEWGVVKCWGWNDEGRLGLGDTLDRGDAPEEMGANLPAVDLIQDVFPPIVIVPGPMSAEATSSDGAVIVFTAVATDAPHPDPAVSCRPVSGRTFLVGTTRVECEATDAVGNTGWATFTVTVRDTTAPVVTVPAEVTVPATGPSGAVVTFEASATDAVGPLHPVVSCEPASGSRFDVGTTTVACSASDTAGNTGRATFQVTVNPFVNPFVQQMSFRSVAAYDGWVLEADETSGKGETFDSAAVTARLGDDAADRQWRAILDFDTSELPDDAVIVGVVLRIKRESITGTNPFSTHGLLLMDMKTGFFHDIQSLEKYDFQAAGSRGNVGRFVKTPDAGWYRAPLRARNYALVNLAGHTQFRLRFEIDDDDDQVADYLSFYTGNTLTVTDRPELVVTYSVP
jgi:alpha-tubulin suppressor-like RCC1 family protein